MKNWPCGDPFDGDLGAVVLSLHHGLTDGAHHGQSVDSGGQQGPQLALNDPPGSSVVVGRAALQRDSYIHRHYCGTVCDAAVT